jgi:hypothetical protein
MITIHSLGMQPRKWRAPTPTWCSDRWNEKGCLLRRLIHTRARRCLPRGNAASELDEPAFPLVSDRDFSDAGTVWVGACSFPDVTHRRGLPPAAPVLQFASRTPQHPHHHCLPEWTFPTSMIDASSMRASSLPAAVRVDMVIGGVRRWPYRTPSAAPGLLT